MTETTPESFQISEAGAALRAEMNATAGKNTAQFAVGEGIGAHTDPLAAAQPYRPGDPVYLTPKEDGGFTCQPGVPNGTKLTYKGKHYEVGAKDWTLAERIIHHNNTRKGNK